MGKTLFYIALFITILYFSDFGFLKGQITEYPLACAPEDYVDYKCTKKWLPLNTTSFKPNKSKQEVISGMNGFPGLETYKKCSVLNRRNWTCIYDDESGEFGFKGGDYYSISLTPSVLEDMDVYRYVPKYIYKLEELKWQ